MTLYAQPVGLTLAQICGVDHTQLRDLNPGKLETTLERVGRDNSAIIVKIETAERLRVHPAFGGLRAEIGPDDAQPHKSPALADMLDHLTKLCQFDAWCVAYLKEPKPERYWGPFEFPDTYDWSDVTAILYNRDGNIRPFCTAVLESLRDCEDEDAPPPFSLLVPLYEDHRLKNALTPMDNPKASTNTLPIGWHSYPALRHQKWRMRSVTVAHTNRVDEYFAQKDAKPAPRQAVHMDAWITKFGLPYDLNKAFNACLEKIPVAGRMFECGVENAFVPWIHELKGHQRELLRVDIFRAAMPAAVWERTIHATLDEYGKGLKKDSPWGLPEWDRISPARMRSLLVENPSSHFAHLLYCRHRRELKLNYANKAEKQADAELFKTAAKARAARLKEMVAFLDDLHCRKSDDRKDSNDDQEDN